MCDPTRVPRTCSHCLVAVHVFVCLLRQEEVSNHVQAICRIPISNDFEDTWAWKFEKCGNFSVRSAYKFLIQQKRTAVQASGSSGGQGESWKKL